MTTSHYQSYKQCISMLTIAPLEVRRAIYIYLVATSVHILRMDDGALRISPCVGPDRNAENVGYERRTVSNPPYCQVWGRRLASSWGLHWECEEIALKYARQRGDDGHVESQVGRSNRGAILRSCKQIHFEIMEVMMQFTTFEVTDLPTLDAILQGSIAYPLILPPFAGSFASRLTRLSITLRLPLAFFKAFDDTDRRDFGKCLSTPISEYDLEVWISLPLRFAKLKTLHSICISLDHTQNRYWSSVNERKFLSHFESLASNPDLDLCFDLPKLHPLAEDPNRHYMSDRIPFDKGSTSLSSWRVHRVLRQKYLAELTPNGHYQVIPIEDFPLSFGHSIVGTWPLQKIETWERSMWLEGKPLQQVLSTLSMT